MRRSEAMTVSAAPASSGDLDGEDVPRLGQAAGGGAHRHIAMLRGGAHDVDPARVPGLHLGREAQAQRLGEEPAVDGEARHTEQDDERRGPQDVAQAAHPGQLVVQRVVRGVERPDHEVTVARYLTGDDGTEPPGQADASWVVRFQMALTRAMTSLARPATSSSETSCRSITSALRMFDQTPSRAADPDQARRHPKSSSAAAPAFSDGPAFPRRASCGLRSTA